MENVELKQLIFRHYKGVHMSNIIGNHLRITLFGESHGPCIGAVLDGLGPGLKIDEEKIKQAMKLRRAIPEISTPRKEDDIVKIMSGVKDGYSEGTSIMVLIENTNTRSHDYDAMKQVARPGHADYSGQLRYLGFQDIRGGGHFSGRLTAGLVAIGSILKQALEQKGIYIGSHIEQLHHIKDVPFSPDQYANQIQQLNAKLFAVLDDEIAKQMIDCIKQAKENHDSVGGILETVIYGLEGGVGDPTFDSIESQLAHAIFSIGAVKGLSFGSGFELANMFGSQANDPFTIKDDKVVTTTNHNGGINGGISNGMPIVFHTVIKPTSSIGKSQSTVNFVTKENVELQVEGRHDPAIIHRARVVVDSMTAFVIADMLCGKYGERWFVHE